MQPPIPRSGKEQLLSIKDKPFLCPHSHAGSRRKRPTPSPVFGRPCALRVFRSVFGSVPSAVNDGSRKSKGEIFKGFTFLFCSPPESRSTRSQREMLYPSLSLSCNDARSFFRASIVLYPLEWHPVFDSLWLGFCVMTTTT